MNLGTDVNRQWLDSHLHSPIFGTNSAVSDSQKRDTKPHDLRG